jgi:carbon monoxide dehydrogenase subunit G
MKVKIDKDFEVGAPIGDVWALLSDPNKIVGCVPGAKITETVDVENYKGTVSLKVGPVVTNFKGDIAIETLDEENHRLVLKGDGMDVKGKGSASMTMTGNLSSLESGGTRVDTSMEVTVIGKLAQFGARLMEDVSNRMFEQFVSCFESKLDTPPAAEPAIGESGGQTSAAGSSTEDQHGQQQENQPINAIPLFFSVLGSAISRFFKRLFGGGGSD